MSFLMPVEARGIRQYGTTRKDCDSTLCLLRGSQYTEDTFGPGNRDAFTFELIDDVARPLIRRRG